MNLGDTSAHGPARPRLPSWGVEEAVAPITCLALTPCLSPQPPSVLTLHPSDRSLLCHRLLRRPQDYSDIKPKSLLLQVTLPLVSAMAAPWAGGTPAPDTEASPPRVIDLALPGAPTCCTGPLPRSLCAGKAPAPPAPAWEEGCGPGSVMLPHTAEPVSAPGLRRSLSVPFGGRRAVHGREEGLMGWTLDVCSRTMVVPRRLPRGSQICGNPLWVARRCLGNWV